MTAKRHKIKFQFPLSRTHAGIAMGNGMFGALVWGVDKINITVNRSDFWDHRGAEYLVEGMSYRRLKEAYASGGQEAARQVFQSLRQAPQPNVRYPSRLPMGRFELALADGAKPLRGILDTGSGILRVELMDGCGRSRLLRFSLHPRRPLLMIEDDSGLIGSIRARPAWDWVGEEMEKYGFKPPRIIHENSLSAWAQECPADFAMAAVSMPLAKGGGFAISMRGGETGGSALDSARAEIGGIVSRRAFLLEVKEWWGAFWKGKPVVSLPSGFFSQFMDYALYKFACATNPSSDLPCSLQGPWVEEYQLPPWSGDYTINENIQQIYALAFPCGALESLIPLFKWLEALRDLMRRNAKILVGIDDGLVLTHSVDDRGAALHGGLGTQGSLDQGCGAWLAQLHWLYYRHSGDKEFLRSKAMPFMKGVMRVYEAMLEKDGGKLFLALSVSPEYGQPLPCERTEDYYERLVREGRNASFQLAAMHMLASALLAAAADLGEKPDPIWLEIKERLPEYTLIGSKHNRHIAIWEGQDLAVPHRHHSHLASIYPFDTLGELSQERQAIVDNSIDHWVNAGLGDASEWSLPWSSIILARTGRPDAAYLHLKIWRELFLNEGLASVYIPRFKGISMHSFKKVFADGLRDTAQGGPAGRESKELGEYEIMQLDGTMGAASAIYEMLAQDKGSGVHVFPAIPSRWKDVCFSGLHVAGGFAVGGRMEAGEIAEVTVKAKASGKLRIMVAAAKRCSVLQGGKAVELALPCELELSKAEEASLVDFR